MSDKTSRAADLPYVKAKVESEGFEYAFVSYSDFSEVDDEEFHRLRRAYLEARRELAEHIDYNEA